MTRTVDEWAQEVERLWPFKVTNYPGFETIPLDERRAAALRHVMLHCAKDAGRMAAAVERIDHGERLDDALLYRPTRNLLVNALRLCRLLGLRPSALLKDYARELEPAVRSDAAAMPSTGSATNTSRRRPE